MKRVIKIGCMISVLFLLFSVPVQAVTTDPVRPLLEEAIDIEKQIMNISRNMYTNFTKQESNAGQVCQLKIYETRLNQLKKDVNNIDTDSLVGTQRLELNNPTAIILYMDFLTEQLRTLATELDSNVQYGIFFEIFRVHSLIESLLAYYR